MRTVVGILALLAAGCSSALACDLRVEAAWIREPPPKAATLAGFATLVNGGSKPVRIVAAESTIAGMVMLHETMMHGDMAMMRDVPELVVPAGGKVELAPGSKHLMLMGTKVALKVGDHVTITLIDDSGCRIAGDFSVRAR
jgi:periplasmic copper chaperone A